MSLILPDTTNYYVNCDYAVLFQGDIVHAEEIGLKQGDDSPDYWLIITKSCDLAFRNDEKKVKNDVLSILGIYSITKQLDLIRKKYFTNPKNDFLGRIVLAGVLKFSESTKAITRKEHLINLVDDKISKLMFLPPDGKIFTEPMVVDFDLIYPLLGEDIENVIRGKRLQLASPFKERLAQRFALHYSSIGIDDNEVKSPSYREKLKKHFESLK